MVNVKYTNDLKRKFWGILLKQTKMQYTTFIVGGQLHLKQQGSPFWRLCSMLLLARPGWPLVYRLIIMARSTRAVIGRNACDCRLSSRWFAGRRVVLVVGLLPHRGHVVTNDFYIERAYGTHLHCLYGTSVRVLIAARYKIYDYRVRVSPKRHLNTISGAKHHVRKRMRTNDRV